ncbi:MAG: RNA polymerase sigma factor [Planctomycetota bacterium]|jgi:RNA polymerase sigma factor (sigma-70 family)
MTVIQSSQEQPEFAEKLAESRNGNREALVSLLSTMAPAIRQAVSIAPQWASVFDVDDVVQVTFMEAYLRLGQFVSDTPQAFESWLKMIAKNNVRAGVRALKCAKRPQPSRRIQQNLNDGSSHADVLRQIAALTNTPSRKVASSEARGVLEDALQRLPDQYAAAIRLHYFEGVGGEELGDRLNKSRGAAYMVLARAREHLGEIIGSQSKFFTDTP